MLTLSSVQVICLWLICAEGPIQKNAVSVKKQLKSAAGKAQWKTRRIFKSDPWVGFCKSHVLELACVFVVLFCWRINALAKAFFVWIKWLHWSKCRWLVFIHLCLTIKSRKSPANLVSSASNWDAPKGSCCGWAGLIVTLCPFWLSFRRFHTHSSYFQPMLWELGGTQ